MLILRRQKKLLYLFKLKYIRKNYRQILEQQWRTLFNRFITKEFQLVLWIETVHTNDLLFHNESQQKYVYGFLYKQSFTVIGYLHSFKIRLCLHNLLNSQYVLMDNEPILPASSNVPKCLEYEINFYWRKTSYIICGIMNTNENPRQNENPRFLFQS